MGGRGMHTRTLRHREPDAEIEALAERFGCEAGEMVESLQALQADAIIGGCRPR